MKFKGSIKKRGDTKEVYEHELSRVTIYPMTAKIKDLKDKHFPNLLESEVVDADTD